VPPGAPILVLRGAVAEAAGARRRPERFAADAVEDRPGDGWRADFTVPEGLRAALAEGGELELGSLLLPLPGASAEVAPLPAPEEDEQEEEALAALREAQEEADAAGRERAALEREAAERIRRLAAERDEARALLARAEEELEELRALVEALEDERPAGPAVAPALAPLDALTASGAPWVRLALRRVAAADPALAGEIVLALLPAQHLAVLGPLAYVLEAEGRPPREIRVAGGRTWVGAPPGEPERALRLRLSELAALSTRRGVWGRVRAQGKPRQALRALGRAPLSFGGLEAADVALPAPLAYALLSATVPPAWTAGHAFTLEHDGCLVGVGEGGILVLPGPPAVPPAAVIAGPPERTLAFLLGREDAAEVSGHAQAAELLQAWTKRLEAGETPRARPR
jgi:hypothetical protein